MKIANFKDLMAGFESADIVHSTSDPCPGKNEVVRELTVRDKIVSGGWGVIKVVHIESGPDAVDVPINTPVYYEAWALDRGNLLFYTGDDAGAGEEMKLCTEADEIRYPDGTVDSVYPEDNPVYPHKLCGFPNGWTNEEVKEVKEDWDEFVHRWNWSSRVRHQRYVVERYG